MKGLVYKLRKTIRPTFQLSNLVGWGFGFWVVLTLTVTLTVTLTSYNPNTKPTVTVIVTLTRLPLRGLWPGSIRREWPGSGAVHALDKK